LFLAQSGLESPCQIFFCLTNPMIRFFALGLCTCLALRQDIPFPAAWDWLKEAGDQELLAEWIPPERHSFEWLPCSAEPIHCGQDYFKEVYEHFQTANEIIVQGWWYVIDAPLFAPVYGETPTISLKELIRSAAMRGAHIYCLFWKTALSEQLGYPVEQTAAELTALHPNVHTLVDTTRHLTPTLLWSAHIKVTVFDRKLAYAGGVDFAGSRLDGERHILPDQARTPNPEHARGQHANFKPWQDVMVRVKGEPAEDLATVAIERWWTFCDQLITSTTPPCSAKHKPQLVSLGVLNARLVTKAQGGKAVELRIDAGYDVKVVTLRGVNHTISQDLGNRRDLSVRSFVNLKGQADRGLFFSPRRAARTDARPSCAVFGAESAGPISFSDCQCKANSYLAGTAPACKTERMSVKFYFKDVAGTDCFCQDYTTTVWLNDLRAGKDVRVAGNVVHLRLAKPAVGALEEQRQQCRVLLTGDNTWFGGRQVMVDIYQEHKKLIAGATSSVYIENQYFGSKLSPRVTESLHSCSKLLSSAQNDLATDLYQKITTKAKKGEPFSVVIVIPLATEECETHYPNLQNAQCLEEALKQFWVLNNIRVPLKNYFGMHHLANVVPYPREAAASAFYGIFVHSKLLVVDYDKPGAESIVGSANLNDRSLLANRDAEVSVGVKGQAFAQDLMSKLLRQHADIAPPASEQLATEMARVAASNVAKLSSLGLDWSQGTFSGKPFLNQNVDELLGRPRRL
ncbi:unnamed protein product, partial [Effrenium voratum]